jgi:hypothetical protein
MCMDRRYRFLLICAIEISAVPAGLKESSTGGCGSGIRSRRGKGLMRASGARRGRLSVDLQEEGSSKNTKAQRRKETEEREGERGQRSAGGLGGEVEKVQVSRFKWSSGTVNRAANHSADPCRLQHAPACNVLRECPALSTAGILSCDRRSATTTTPSWSAHASRMQMRYGSSREGAVVTTSAAFPYPH